MLHLPRYKKSKSLSGRPAATDYVNDNMFKIYNSSVVIVPGFAETFALASQRQSITSVLKRLCEIHTAIAVDPNMLGGQPHVKGFRLSVGDILSKLYIHGDIEKLQSIYPDLSINQIKEAIAFSQDFLEEMSVAS